ncbi:MAG: aspartate--tRNA(Asn) ligase [archaeon]
MPTAPKYRTHYSAELSGELDGREVSVAGWVHSIRDLKAVKFLVIRDRTGTVQVVANAGTDPETFSGISGLSQEDVVSVRGRVLRSEKARAGFEIAPEKLEILAKSKQPLPLDPAEKTPALIDTRLDNRFLDVRKRKVAEIFMLESELLAETRKFFRSSGFVEINTPKIVAAGAEGGATLFPVKYYDKQAYLAQSPQLYKQMMMASGLDRVFEIAPAYRAEKSNTIRHLAEFISIDCELAFIHDENDVMDVMEDLVKALVRTTGEFFPGREGLLKVDYPFPRITCEEGAKLLNRPPGGDFSSEEEKELGRIMSGKGNEFFFLTKYASEIKPFYIMEDSADPRVCRSFDLEFRGMEVTSGGQREHRPEELERRMKTLGLEPKDFEFYTGNFRYGMPPHGGFGFGIARFVQMLLGLDSIREAVLFPRDMSRLVP